MRLELIRVGLLVELANHSQYFHVYLPEIIEKHHLVFFFFFFFSIQYFFFFLCLECFEMGGRAFSLCIF